MSNIEALKAAYARAKAEYETAREQVDIASSKDDDAREEYDEVVRQARELYEAIGQGFRRRSI